MRALAITLLSAALVLSPSVAVAGSDSPVPYTVTAAGITLPEGVTFPAHGHVNWTTSWARHGVHFDPNNGAHGGKYIGQSFLPFNLEPGECVTWVQVSMFDPHFGEGGQSPVCRDAEQTPTPGPSEPQEPAVPTDEQPTPEPTPEPTEETPWTPEPTPAPTADPTPSESPTSVPSQRPTSPSPAPEPTSMQPTQPSVEPSPSATELATPGSEPTPAVVPSEPGSSDSGATPDAVGTAAASAPLELAATGPGAGAAALASLLLVAGVGLNIASLHRRARR